MSDMRAASTTCVLQPERERKRTITERTEALENGREMMSDAATGVSATQLRNIADNYATEIGSIAAATLRAIADHIDHLEAELNNNSASFSDTEAWRDNYLRRG